MYPPPKEIGARELFERLCELQPTWSVEWLGRSFRVRALTALEWAHVRRDKRAAGFYGLLDDHGQAFQDIAQVGDLHDDDASALVSVVGDALRIIGPTYSRIDWPAWREHLIVGASQSGALSSTIAECIDVAYGYGVGRTTWRPDRFWGVPLSRLNDGHWMVMEASRELQERTRPRK